MSVFTIHEGHFTKGDHHQFMSSTFLLLSEGQSSREAICVSQIDSLETASEPSVEAIFGRSGWGITGAGLNSAAGLPGGAFAGQAGDRAAPVAFVCKLKDGREFLGTATPKLYTNICQSALV